MTQHKKENFMSGIEDKVVVITGASSGIGEATALLLAERRVKRSFCCVTPYACTRNPRMRELENIG